MSVLDRICAEKREHVRVKKTGMPLSALEGKIKSQKPTRGFITKIRERAPALIAEVKKASPSKGVIREDFDPAAIAGAYERAGAACLSVLTDIPFFQGADEYLAQVKAASPLPVLRKDFMLDPYQIYESRALGADCILLIMAALEDRMAAELYALAETLDMDVLVEVHDEAELDRALALNAAMIGINNRSLKTLTVDIATSRKLAPLIPASAVKIAESGIETHEQLTSLHSLGFHGFLVGESLMREADIEKAARKLLIGT